MQHVPEISHSFLSTQTCTNCQLPITCAPVYVINDLSILCGRCRMTAKDHYRNYAYEALASTFLYPCKNFSNHCPVKLRWNDSLDHEQECNYTGCCTFFCRHPGAFCKGKRSFLQDDEGNRFTQLPDNLLEDLECVICRGYLNSSPIFIQSNGHNVCHRCVHANGNPPNCRRNISYENFSQIFIFPCTNRGKGCTERQQFGLPIWRHEATCAYAPNKIKNNPVLQERNLVEEIRQSIRRNDFSRRSVIQSEPARPSFMLQNPLHIDVQPNLSNYRASRTEHLQQGDGAKEKGVIKTGIGHIWATITPNNLPPPVAKKPGRHIRRADEIGNEMGRRNSESESISTIDTYNMRSSGFSSPEHVDYTQRLYIPPEDYSISPQVHSRPHSRESGYQTGPLTHRYPEDYETNNGSGQYPDLMPHQLDDPVRRISKREGSIGNPLLINELKIRQDAIRRTHSIKGDQDLKSPYRHYSNLNEIREINRHMR